MTRKQILKAVTKTFKGKRIDFIVYGTKWKKKKLTVGEFKKELVDKLSQELESMV